MRISAKYDFAFLCMPKCASTSIESALLPYSQLVTRNSPGLKHTNYKRYETYIMPYINISTGRNPQTICLFREPIEWLHSWYKYRKRDALKGKRKSTSSMTFDEFCIRYMKQDKNVSSIGMQSKFVENKKGLVGVDVIFAYENLDLFKKFMEEKIKNNLEIPMKNVSPSVKPETIDSGVRRDLEKYLEKDYSIYNKILNNNGVLHKD